MAKRRKTSKSKTDKSKSAPGKSETEGKSKPKKKGPLKAEVIAELKVTKERAAEAENQLRELEDRLCEMEGMLEFSEQRAEVAESFAQEHADSQNQLTLVRMEYEELQQELRQLQEEMRSTEALRADFEDLAEDAEVRAYENECALLQAEDRARQAEAKVAKLEKRLCVSPVGVAERELFLNLLEVGLRQAHRYGRKVAIMGFGLLTQHDIAPLIPLVAMRLKKVVRDSDILGQLDEETFGIILAEHTFDEDVMAMTDAVSRRARDLFERPLILRGEKIFAEGAFGVSIFPDDGPPPARTRAAYHAVTLKLVDQAEQAVYEAREMKRTGLTFSSALRG